MVALRPVFSRGHIGTCDLFLVQVFNTAHYKKITTITSPPPRSSSTNTNGMSSHHHNIPLHGLPIDFVTDKIAPGWFIGCGKTLDKYKERLLKHRCGWPAQCRISLKSTNAPKRP